jgi:hypothetical protein
MQSRTHTWYALILLAVFGTLTVFGQSNISRDAYTRIGIAPVIGFYKLNSQHARAPRARMSFSAFIKREKSVDRKNRMFLSGGAEYLFHGVSYRSYYFNQDTLQLYDGSMGYNYRLSIGEINIPLQAKLTFFSTTNSLFSPYVAIGYHLRYILNTNVKVDQDGTEIKDEFVHLKFKNPLLYERINSFVGASFGIQNHHTRSQSSGITAFLEISYRYGFSPYFFKTNYSASSVYLSSQHLAINIGLGF